METSTKEQYEEFRKHFEKRHRAGKIFGGLLIVVIGALFLARELGYAIPSWIFTWQMLVIGIGVVGLLKHRFMNFKWWLVVGIGGAFLYNDMYPGMKIEPLVWPILAIVVGLFIMFKPRRHFFGRRHWEKHQARWERHHGMKFEGHPHPWMKEENDSEDFVECTNVFGGSKKNILSKNFKGGSITNVFGGSEINLMQADFEGEVKLELEMIFGGTSLIIPLNWEVKSELTNVFGGIHDERPLPHDVNPGPRKTLILTGNAVFGGVEIKSY